MTVNVAVRMSSSSICFGLRLAPNHLFISLMTSKLIYKRVIYMEKNGSLIARFLSALTVEDVNSGPRGVTALRLLRASWGRYVIIPQSWCSVGCVGHTPCTGVDCVTVPLSENKTQYVTYRSICYVTDVTDWDSRGCSTNYCSARKKHLVPVLAV